MPTRKSAAVPAPAPAPAPGATGAGPTEAAADRVYQAIYAAIVDHRLPPGARLREEELAQSFGVSRTLVRQALHRLAQNGVVQLQHNRGAQVPAPSRGDGENVFDARRLIECEVARRLATRLEKTQLAELRALVAAETRAQREGDHGEAIRLSGEFHRRLAQMSGNPIFVRMLDELLPTTSLLIALYKAPGEPMCVAHSHALLLQVLLQQGAAAAAAEMRRHLNEIERSLSVPVAAPAPALRDVFRAYREGA